MLATKRTIAAALSAASLLTSVLTVSAAGTSTDVSASVKGDESASIEFSTTDHMQQSIRVSDTTEDGTDAEAEERTDRTTTLQRDGYDPLVIHEAERSLVGLFTQVGALDHPMTLDLSEDSLDMAAYVSDPCYTVTGPLEERDCETKFGPYAHLNETLRNGTLKEMLAEHFPLLIFTGQGEAMDRIFQDIDRDADDVEDDTDDEDTDMDEDAEDVDADDDDDTDVMGVEDNGDEELNATERSEMLWEECEAIASDWQAACYQDNLRLIDLDEEISGNVYFQVRE